MRRVVEKYSRHWEVHIDKNNIIEEVILSSFFGDSHAESNLPVLQEVDGDRCFKFTDDKSSYVLGKLKNVDFVLDHEGVAKEHASFVMDINGVRIIPVQKHQTLVDGNALKEPQILVSGSKITFGSKSFIFKESQTNPIPVPISNPITNPTPMPVSNINIKTENNSKNNNLLIKIFDYFFVMCFALASVGVLVIYTNF